MNFNSVNDKWKTAGVVQATSCNSLKYQECSLSHNSNKQHLKVTIKYFRVTLKAKQKVMNLYWKKQTRP